MVSIFNVYLDDGCDPFTFEKDGKDYDTSSKLKAYDMMVEKLDHDLDDGLIFDIYQTNVVDDTMIFDVHPNYDVYTLAFYMCFSDKSYPSYLGSDAKDNMEQCIQPFSKHGYVEIRY